MTISTNLSERLTDAEFDRFDEIETALLKTDMADRIDDLMSLKADFMNVRTLTFPVPSGLQELDDLEERLGCHLELLECLPVLKKVDATGAFVLLGRILFHYYLKLSNQIRRNYHREKNVYETIPSFVAQIKNKKTRPGLDLSSLLELADATKEMAEVVAEGITLHSLPKPNQLLSVSPDCQIYRFGCSARAITVVWTGGFDILICDREGKIKGVYLIAEKKFEAAAKHFANTRDEEFRPYQKRALTAWANLSWLLHSDEEQSRRRYARSISRLAENPHHDGTTEAETIELIKQNFFGEDSQVERDDFDWKKDCIW